MKTQFKQNHNMYVLLWAQQLMLERHLSRNTVVSQDFIGTDVLGWSAGNFYLQIIS